MIFFWIPHCLIRIQSNGFRIPCQWKKDSKRKLGMPALNNGKPEKYSVDKSAIHIYQ